MEEKLHEPAKISTTQGARPSGLRAGAQTEGLAEEARSSERPEAEGKAWSLVGQGPVKGRAQGAGGPLCARNMTVKGNCDRRNGGVHRGAHLLGTGAKGKAPARGALKSGRSAGPHRGRPSRHRGLGKSFSGRSAGQHRGEPSRHRGLGNRTR